MRRPLIVGNWKLHKTLKEALELLDGIKAGTIQSKEVDIAVAPVFTALSAAGTALAGSGIFLAAQNCYPENEGPFTGEVSPALLKDIGCHYVIVGHSERRRLFHEDDAFINAKVRAVVREGLAAIFCVGETLEERRDGATFDVLTGQIKKGLENISSDEMTRVVIAYEPVWAIGTGQTATPGQAGEAHAFIRNLVSELFDDATARTVRILYGGSVKPGNVDSLMAMSDVDGALVGGASLRSEEFNRIVNFRKS